MTDSLPTSLVTYQSHTVSGAGSCGTVPGVGSTGGTLECSWPTILAGASETVTVTVEGVSKGTIDNNVALSSDEIANGWDRLAANNVTSQDSTVRSRTDVQLTKTASAGTVALLEDFTFTILVDVNSGAGLAEADNVTVTDNLPANMELTGPPVVLVTSGTATSTTCTGTAGAGAFSWDPGTVSGGGQVQITVPVQVTAASANPQTRTNTATAATSSLDTVPANNSDDASVDVVSSSLAGTVFRDFADDAVLNGTDSGVPGVTLTLTGTLAGVTPLFGTLATPADPANGPLAPGTYTAAPSASCGSTNAGFNGSGDTTVASGFILPVSGSSALAFSLRVRPVVPVPAGYENQAVDEAVGQTAGQTSATNPQLTDLSDDGTNPDLDGDGQGNEPSENDPTPVAPDIARELRWLRPPTPVRCRTLRCRPRWSPMPSRW